MAPKKAPKRHQSIQKQAPKSPVLSKKAQIIRSLNESEGIRKHQRTSENIKRNSKKIRNDLKANIGNKGAKNLG